MEEEEGLHQHYLPHDLISHHILTKLPIKSVLRFKSVSKLWYSTLSSSQFALTFSKLSSSFHPTSPIQFLFIQNDYTYYLYSYNDDDEIITSYTSFKNLQELGSSDNKYILVGSCNGLICLASSFGNFIILWNPVTGKSQKYLDHKLVIDSSRPFRVSWGFGYVSGVDDYKVIRIIELGATLKFRVHVFSLKSNKWERIAHELYQDIFSLKCTSYERYEFNSNDFELWFPFSFQSIQGVLVNETLYWIVSKANDQGKQVVSFDLVSDKFDTVVDLNLISNFAYEDKFLCVMGGCLSKCGVNRYDDVFINMFKCPGEVETICVSRDLGLYFCQNCVGFTRTGKFFILLDNSILGLIDPSSDLMMYERLVNFDVSRNSHVASYVPSLTLPYTVAE